MSYSRWSTSTWYTYWMVSHSHERDKQLFDVCAVKTFSYKELKDDIEGCINSIRALEQDYKEDEYDELRIYMRRFIKDVESDKEIIIYEDLKNGNISKESIAWYIEEENLSEDFKKEVDEAFKVLYADDEDLPVLMGEVEGNLGKILIQKRFEGAVAQLGERDAGSVEVRGSSPRSSIDDKND